MFFEISFGVLFGLGLYACIFGKKETNHAKKYSNFDDDIFKDVPSWSVHDVYFDPSKLNGS